MHCNSRTGKQCEKSAKFVCDNDFELCSSHKQLKIYSNQKKKLIPKDKNQLCCV